MELPIQQQIFEQFSKSGRILIALPQSLNVDNVGAALGLAQFLKKMGKEADIVAPAPLPAGLEFLPGSQSIKPDALDSKNFVITVDTSKKPLDEISYQAADQKVSIYLKAKEEPFAAEDISFASDRVRYDLAVTINASSLEDLGGLFERHADMFFEVPKISIDNHPGDEYFAAINLVDINATSVGEILAGLLTAYETQLVDEDIATCLLAGIISKTNSFQHAQTTPRAFLKASELISLGGRQQEVVKFLYKTKPLPLLRLWGRALARLKIADEVSAIYSMLNLSDFGKAGASDSDLNAVLKELLDNIAGYQAVALLCEVMGGAVRVLLGVHAQGDAQKILAAIGGRQQAAPYRMGAFAVYDISLEDMSLLDAERKFLQSLAPEAQPA